jgi:hypothetical protein
MPLLGLGLSLRRTRILWMGEEAMGGFVSGPGLCLGGRDYLRELSKGTEPMGILNLMDC